MEHLTSHNQLSELTAFPQTGLHHYLLLDGVKMEPVLQWIYQCIDNPEWYPLYKNTRYDDVLDISPCLVKIPEDSDITDKFEYELGLQGKAILLSSSFDIEVLGGSLSQLLWVMTDSGQYLHFRFYDPITLSRLMPSLQSEETSALYKGIEHMIWFDAKQRTWKKRSAPSSRKDICHSGCVQFKAEWVDALVATD